MAKREKNQPIGEMECPMKGCKETARVFRYRERSSEEGRRRFAGRVYCACPNGHRCEGGESILGVKWDKPKGAEVASAPPVAPVVSAPVKPAPKPQQKTPAKTVSAPVRAPAPKEPARTSAAPVQESQPKEPAKRGGWGFFS